MSTIISLFGVALLVVSYTSSAETRSPMHQKMTKSQKPKVLCAPNPRRLDLIFTQKKFEQLRDRYDLIEVAPNDINSMNAEQLSGIRYILGQPPIASDTLDKLKNLRAVLNVESNLIDNMPYETLFSRGIHVLTTGAVFAVPVAEIALGFALDLARGITTADTAFSNGLEKWGGDGNTKARMLRDADIGIVGFGDLGRALTRLLSGFRCNISVFDPWLPPSILEDHLVTAADLDTILSKSDFVFVMAAVTSENQKFIGKDDFSKMRKGSSFILMSRSDVVDFEALLDAVEKGEITAAIDVWPQEPLPPNHRARHLPGLLRSAHRAGALDIAFKKMGDMVLEDMDLMDRSLPPMRCKRAERETAKKMKSRPVDKN